MNPEELVRRYGPIVYNLALRLTGNRAEAEDLAQDSLLKAVRGWQKFRGDADPGTWLYRITVNAWKNRLRAARWRVARFLSLDGGPDPDSEPIERASSDLTPESEAENRERRARVEAALGTLTPEERAVLVLRELDGCSYQQIADSLGLPLGTVKSRLARARLLLAEALAPEENRHAA